MMLLSMELGCDANIYIDEKDKQTVIFAYPNLFTNASTLQIIRLEIGALAAWTPAKHAKIEPYSAIYYPKIFDQKDTSILTVSPEIIKREYQRVYKPRKSSISGVFLFI